MPQFEGKVKRPNGVVEVVAVQARNEAEAKLHLNRIGRIVTFKKKRVLDLREGLSAADRQIFFNRVASMLESRMGTSETLKLMRDTFTGRIQEVAGRALGYVEAGNEFAVALELVGTKDFPAATIALIKAGARTGHTARAVKDAAGFEYQLHNIKQTASRGLWMGVSSFIGAGILTLVSTFYMGPQIMDSALIKAANANGAVNIAWVNTSSYVVGYVMGVIMFFAIALWLLATVGRRFAPVGADNLVMKIPFYKDLVLSKNNFIVLYGLSLLVKAGVRMEEALRLSAQGAPHGALRHDLLNANEAVRTGRPWPRAMTTLHPTDKAALLSASDREQVSDTLDTLANQYRELYSQRLSSFVPATNLLAALFLAISGTIMFGQTILPMLQASKGLF